MQRLVQWRKNKPTKLSLVLRAWELTSCATRSSIPWSAITARTVRSAIFAHSPTLHLFDSRIWNGHWPQELWELVTRRVLHCRPPVPQGEEHLPQLDHPLTLQSLGMQTGVLRRRRRRRRRRRLLHDRYVSIKSIAIQSQRNTVVPFIIFGRKVPLFPLSVTLK